MSRTTRTTRTTRRTLRGTAALALPAAVLGLAACSVPGSTAADEGDSTGVTEDTVLVGTHTPLTGPAAAGYSSISAAAGAYFDYLNDQGGINGRTIQFVVKDDGYNPANTQTVVRELVTEDEVFAILNGLGTPTHSSVLDYLDQNDVPDLFVASGSTSWDQPEEYPWTYAFNVDYAREAKALAHYAQDELDGSVYCVLGQDDDFGAEFQQGLEAVLGADGLESVQTYSVSNEDVSAQIGAMQAAGCDTNFLATVNGFTALAVGTAAQLGYQAQWLSSSSGGDYPTLVGYLGEDIAPALLEGFVSTNYLSFSPDDPWAEHFRTVNEEYNEGATFDGNTVYGMSVAYTFAEALAKAGEDPTRESLVEALESGDVVGAGIMPIGFSADSHAAYSGAGITSVTGGVQDYVGPIYTTDDAEGPVEDFTGEAVPFADDGVPQP
ncbi:ABC transporter substrate-binding protein [Cellulosimicrobium terreum]|nr:ABC transporter substrate-binding protein [Cellulosimicrobium terreum]